MPWGVVGWEECSVRRGRVGGGAKDGSWDARCRVGGSLRDEVGEEGVLSDDGQDPRDDGCLAVVANEVHPGALRVDGGEGLLDEGLVVSRWQFGVGEECPRDPRGCRRRAVSASSTLTSEWTHHSI